MTEETPDTEAATVATPPPVIEPTNPNAQPEVSNAEFAIPDAYKDKPWAGKVKSQDDLWKQLDNTNALIGKKTVLPDLENATDKEIEDYYGAMRPQDKAAYQFGEETPAEAKEAFAEMLHKHGIPARQGNDLIKAYQEHEKSIITKMYDKDDFLGVLKTSFGNDYEKVSGETAKTLAANLNADDKALLEKVPNQYLGLIYRVTANLNKAFGATEGGAAVNTPSNVGVVDIEVTANKLRDDIAAINRRAHTVDEKQALVNQLADLYKTPTKR